MDSEASTSEIPLKFLKPENDNFKKVDAKKSDDLKQFEGQRTAQDEKGEKKLPIVKKKVSTSSSAKSSSKCENTEECKNDNDDMGRKNFSNLKEITDEQKPSTSKASESIKIPSKQKLIRSKKLSVEEIQRPFDPLKVSSKRRRSSIPDFSQEESVGTNPALFIWHKEAFKDDLPDQEEYLTSDPIESEVEDIENEPSPNIVVSESTIIEVEDIENEPSPNMVVSESTIMFIHPETSSIASNTVAATSAEQQIEGFHISDPEDDLVDDAFEDSEISENAFDIIVEEVDIKTGTTIDTPRSSDSGSDLLISPSAEELLSSENIFEKPTSKISNSSFIEPLEVISEEPKNDKLIISDSENLLPSTSKIPEKFENDIECVETVKEVSLQKPPRPPSRTKKLSMNLDTQQQPSTSATESSSSAPDEALKAESLTISKFENSSEFIESFSASLSSSPPILTAPPIPPPPKSISSKSSRQEI
uniref:Uncharacterized protein n=1 Tax=Panagrolaimus sp. ES5 TaxID=591445 RepID=A0AC34G8S0_9BILA